MGITRFSGPVYGAKSLLGIAAFNSGSSGASSQFIRNWVVPPYETWYLTEMMVYCSSNSSNANFKLKVKGTSTSATAPGPGPDPNFPTGNPSTGVFNVSMGASTVNTFVQALPVSQTPGEYEGYAAPANSSIRLVSTSVNPLGPFNVGFHGFVRYIDSTRSV